MRRVRSQSRASRTQKGMKNHMPKNKETSTRGAGKEQKLLSGTRNQLIKDLRRVHKLFPQADPDRDFYRKHGKFADAAWKEHFPRFKDFVAASGVALAYPQLMWHLKQVHAILSTRGDQQSDQEAGNVRHELYCLFSAMTETMGVPAPVYVAAAREAAGREDGAA
jgi:hypothetical protein